MPKISKSLGFDTVLVKKHPQAETWYSASCYARGVFFKIVKKKPIKETFIVEPLQPVTFSKLFISFMKLT